MTELKFQWAHQLGELLPQFAPFPQELGGLRRALVNLRKTADGWSSQPTDILVFGGHDTLDMTTAQKTLFYSET